jgi:hypothetical protein
MHGLVGVYEFGVGPRLGGDAGYTVFLFGFTALLQNDRARLQIEFVKPYALVNKSTSERYQLNIQPKKAPPSIPTGPRNAPASAPRIAPATAVSPASTTSAGKLNTGATTTIPVT